MGPVPGVSFVLSYCILFFPKCKDRLPQGGLLFLFTRKEKEAKRKAARAIKIKVQNLGLQALAYALCLGEAEGRVGRDTGGTPEGVTPAARRFWLLFYHICGKFTTFHRQEDGERVFYAKLYNYFIANGRFLAYNML